MKNPTLFLPLELREGRPDWRLDEATREAGRRGVEASRRALQEARSRQARQAQDARRAA